MKEGTSKDKDHLKTLANQFLLMSQKGTVGFYEKTVIESLVDYFLDEGNQAVALDLADWGIQLYPYSGSLVYLKAEILYLNKKYPGALRELDNAIALDPKDADSFLLKARILIEMGRYDQATETLYELGKGNIGGNAQANVHLCYASIYENLDRHDDMFNSLCDALRADWDNEDILERLGLCTEFCLKHNEHIEFLQEYLDERPYSSIAWFNIGHSYWYIKDYENAVSAFEYAFFTDKFFKQAYVDCSEVLMKMQAYQRALSYYNDAIKNWPKEGDLYVGRGNALFMMQEYEKALMSYKKAAHSDNMNAEAYYGKGLCYMEMGVAEKAIQSLTKATELDNRREEFAAALGEVFYMTGDTIAAAEAFNRAIELAPEMSEYWIRNITFLMDENRFDEALENIQAAIVNTFGTELKYCHAAYHFRRGNRKEGIQVLQQAMNEDYTMHTSLLDLCPDLGEDNEVMSIIATYRS